MLLSTRIHPDWKGFLRIDNNKDELYKLLATMCKHIKPRSKPCYSLGCSNTTFYIHFLDGFATASRGEESLRNTQRECLRHQKKGQI